MLVKYLESKASVRRIAAPYSCADSGPQAFGLAVYALRISTEHIKRI